MGELVHMTAPANDQEFYSQHRDVLYVHIEGVNHNITSLLKHLLPHCWLC